MSRLDWGWGLAVTVLLWPIACGLLYTLRATWRAITSRLDNWTNLALNCPHRTSRRYQWPATLLLAIRYAPALLTTRRHR